MTLFGGGQLRGGLRYESVREREGALQEQDYCVDIFR